MTLGQKRPPRPAYTRLGKVDRQYSHFRLRQQGPKGVFGHPPRKPGEIGDPLQARPRPGEGVQRGPEELALGNKTMPRRDRPQVTPSVLRENDGDTSISRLQFETLALRAAQM